MPDEWMVRVEGKEYGPVDLEEMRAWKEEGRLIRENEVREPGSERWIPAGELPELFADEPTPPEPEPAIVRPAATLGGILRETWQIYRRGFGGFLGLSAMLAVPWVCGQLSNAGLGPAAAGEPDLRSALASLFNFLMFLAILFAWPVYVAGIQILSAELAQGRSIILPDLVPQALKHWPRVAPLCLLVFSAFVLLALLAFAILLLVASSPSSPILILFALLLLFSLIWMCGRVFVSVLFWQQTTVLEEKGVVDSIRRSNQLARSRRDLPWWRRPLWHGVILASLWSIIPFAVTIGSEWRIATEYYHILTTVQDPQAMLQALSAVAAKPAGLASWSLVLGVVVKILQPLLGIAFVVLYLHTKGPTPPRLPND